MVITNEAAFKVIEDGLEILKAKIKQGKPSIEFSVKWTVGKGNNTPDIDMNWKEKADK